ncbi:MerR family transcriptional regulator [Kaistia algarum]|uniref:MerR family transcriptional regulator n=1 Tax=Kaistia algarum TaxID=2083279 RepID=UPI000CE809CC|nr:helix-turn-helix domain-containing protein [Kaistia algarum]MCX5514402.1 helix-turn-helix domain-containing protein [Kaistia algarum]PPE79145.1 MerR family transcriptional regulator [Kaistia algarum]
MQRAEYSIGEASRTSGVKITTIRFYEQIGLLAAAARTEGNRRVYDAADLKRLSFIRHARELGFSVDDIRELLGMTEQTNSSCHEADSLAKRRLKDVDRRIEQLTALKSELQRMVDECGHGRICDCRVIQILGDHAQCQHEAH